MTRHCACCGKLFKLRPQVPDQTFCSSRDCQRDRKTKWQRDKRKSDPDYRADLSDSQKRWSQRNQDY